MIDSPNKKLNRLNELSVLREKSKTAGKDGRELVFTQHTGITVLVDEEFMECDEELYIMNPSNRSSHTATQFVKKIVEVKSTKGKKKPDS